MSEFINNSNRKFADISSEYRRVYHFPDPYTVIISNPKLLSVSTSGHYIYDGEGKMHYVPFGWRQLTWFTLEGQPNVVI